MARGVADEHSLIAANCCGIGKAALAPLAAALLQLGLATRARGEFQVCAAGSDQSRPSVATAAGTTLVVWQDSRNSALTGVDIRGVLLDAGGARLDPPGELVVCDAAGDQSFPRVATDGDGFLVVWQDGRDSATNGLDIYAARVSTSGEVSPAGGLAVAALAGDQKYPDAAWAGSLWVVAWEHPEGSDWNIHAARVSATGELLDPTPIVVDATASKQDSVCAAGSAGRALLAYRDSSGGTHIRGAIVDVAGSVAAPFTIANANSTQKSPRAAFGGGVWLVAWEDWRDSNADIYAARVDPFAGGVLDLAPHIAICADGYASTSPAVAFDGGNFVVAWTDDRNVSAGGGLDVYSARVTPSGALRAGGAAAVVTAASDQEAPALARSGAGAIAVWADGRGASPADIYGTVLATNDPPVALADASSLQPSEGDIVTLDGSASSDPEGAALLFEWSQLEGPPCALDDPAKASPSFAAPEALSPYTLRFSLRVSDGASWSAPAELALAVSADDDPPVAVAVAPAAAGEGELVALDGSGSFDPEGLPLSYSWVQVSGPRVALADPAGESTSFRAPDRASGYALAFALAVSDGTNESAPVQVAIQVSADDDPPVAYAGEDYAVPPLALAGLDGSGSSDPEGRALTYRWTQVSGPAVALSGAAGALASFVAPDAASETALVFRLAVSDGANESSDELEVRVLPSGAEPVPVASEIAVSASETEASVTWSTDPVAAAGLVRWGTTRALGSESPEEAGFAASHSVLLAGLRSGATYWYVVRSRNSSGAWSLSEPRSFQTLPPSALDDPDGDGIPDWWELAWGFDPPSAFGALDDPDADGLPNVEEYRHGTDPLAWDTDGDGFADRYEVTRDSNPLRSDSVPIPSSRADSAACGSPIGGAALAWAVAALVAGRGRAGAARGRHRRLPAERATRPGGRRRGVPAGRGPS